MPVHALLASTAGQRLAPPAHRRPAPARRARQARKRQTNYIELFIELTRMLQARQMMAYSAKMPPAAGQRGMWGRVAMQQLVKWTPAMAVCHASKRQCSSCRWPARASAGPEAGAAEEYFWRGSPSP